MTDPRAVGLQYDLGVSSTVLGSKLLDLIKAASEDNVQPQAVLALRALGSMIQPTPKLINDAINALNGTKNVKLEHMALTLGFTSNNTALFLRQSTPGIAGFLMICSLKLAHTNTEIGEILFQMAAESGVLKNWPASSMQLVQLAEALAGHACSLIPMEQLNHITSLFDFSGH